MTKMVLFLVSFISFLVFLILVFQNIGMTATVIYFNILFIMMNMTPGGVLAIGFMLGLFVAIPMLIFVRSGGNVKITSAQDKSTDGNLEWD